MPHAPYFTPSPAVLAITTGTRAEFMRAEEQREADFGHLQATELNAACRLPLAARGPTIANRRCTAARPSLEHVPDERLLRTRIATLNCDAESPAPSRHCAIGTGR